MNACCCQGGVLGQDHFPRKVEWPSYIADPCVIMRQRPAGNFELPEWMALNFLADAVRRGRGDAIVGSTELVVGPNTITLAETAGSQRMVAGFYVEMNAGTSEGTPRINFSIAMVTEEGESITLGAYNVQQKASGRAGVVLFPYFNAAQGASISYPVFAHLAEDFAQTVVPVDAFGQGIPAQATTLNLAPNRRAVLTVTGTVGSEVTFQTLSVNDDIWPATMVSLLRRWGH